MACNPIFQYADISCKKPLTGIAELYLISYFNLKEVNDQIYTISSNDTVNNIFFQNGVIKFVKIGILPKSALMKNNYTFNPATGVSEFNEELTFPIVNINSTARKVVKVLSTQPVVALMKFATGVWYILGLDGQMYLTTAQGYNDGSNNSYNLTFTGVANDFSYVVDPVLIPFVITDYAQPPTEGSGIFQKIFQRIFK